VARYKITVEYDGGPFVGWQRQETGPSIQAALEDAVFAFTGERVHVQGAGRTDAGVHARGQVAHFDLAREQPIESVRGAMTFHLRPHPIVVPRVEFAVADFHARFSATWRRYRYRILNRRTPAALDRGQVWHVPMPLDAEAMAEAASVLLGRHDFDSFRSVNCQAASSIKTLDLLAVRREGEEVAIDVGARSFLHNQVRILVGTLQLVGRGQWTRRDVEAALAARDRTRAGPTAPPLGLCLMEVRYDPAGTVADGGSAAHGCGHDAEEADDDE
jgi:tRNA pseudouridine38-40 synthase